MAKEKEVVEVVEAPKVSESDAKKAFKKLVELYKVQNPAKYELKKAELEDKLSKL